MYKGGKLTKEARAQLEKRYQKERSKDSILAKIDKKQQRRKIKKTTVSTTHTIPKVNKKNSIQKTTQGKNVSTPTKTKSEKTMVYNMEDDISDECPSSPPRNDMVLEREMIMKANKGVNWVSLTKHNQKVATAETDLYLNLSENAKLDFKASLEDEIRVRENIRTEERKEILKYQNEQKDLYKSWDKEDEEKAYKKHEKTQELKSMREQQISELEAKRTKLYKKELRREIRQAKKNELERQEYEQDIIDKKRKKYDDMQQVLIENAKQKEITLEEEKKLAEEEIELQQQYAEMLKKQEESRAKKLAATYAQADQKAANLLDCTAEERRKQKEFEERAERELEKRQEREDMAEKLKKEGKQKENMEIQDYLGNQIQEKEDKLIAEIIEDRKWGKEMNVAAVKSLEKDVVCEEQRKKGLYDQANYIKNQIAKNEKRRIEERADMSEREKNMNMGAIKEVQNGQVNVKEQPFDPKRPFAWRYNYRSKPF